MAELIDRNSLLANLNKFAPEHFNALVNDLIKKEPVATTEAEIRNKAIDDFFDELQKYEKDDWLKLKMLSIYHIAEQLKEE